MYIYNIAILWTNGDVEGFAASALSETGAYNRAVNKAAHKSRSIGKPFKVLSKAEYNALSVYQQDQLQADWDNEVL